MGLFDSVAGAMLGKVMGDKGALIQTTLDMVEQHGGVAGVIEKFKQGGVGELVESWVGTGENLTISAEQIEQVLGDTMIANAAAKVGMNSQELSEKIAEYLPTMIDKLTPNGRLEQDPNLMKTLMAMFK